MSDVGEIRVQLESIAEQLSDLTMSLLRDAIENGAERRPPEEKSLSQARRAVEKAARLLERLESS